MNFQPVEALPKKEDTGSKAMPAKEFRLEGSEGQRFV